MMMMVRRLINYQKKIKLNLWRGGGALSIERWVVVPRMQLCGGKSQPDVRRGKGADLWWNKLLTDRNLAE